MSYETDLEDAARIAGATIAELIRQRDSARRLAVTLEQELAYHLTERAPVLVPKVADPTIAGWWRVMPGRTAAANVYETDGTAVGGRSVATFHRVGDADRAVAAVNAGADRTACTCVVDGCQVHDPARDEVDAWGPT